MRGQEKQKSSTRFPFRSAAAAGGRGSNESQKRQLAKSSFFFLSSLHLQDARLEHRDMSTIIMSDANVSVSSI